MDVLAEAAGVSKPTLYRYYQSKEALLVAVLEQLALHHLSETTLLAWQDRPMDCLTTLEQALTVWAQETIKTILYLTYLGLLQLLIAELSRFPSLGELFTQAVPQQGGAFLMRLLKSAQEHGVIEVDELEPAMCLLAGSLLTYVLGSGLLATETLRQVPLPEQTAALVHLFLQGAARHDKQEI